MRSDARTKCVTASSQRIQPTGFASLRSACLRLMRNVRRGIQCLTSYAESIQGEVVIMNDPRIENLAKILVHYSTKVKENDKVMIRGFPLEPIAAPLIAEVFREVLKAGGHPHIAIDPENIRYIFLTEASEHQLRQPDLVSKMVAEEFDVDIRIGCDSNTRSLTSVKPETWKLIARAYTDINDTWSRRSASGELRWVVSRFPTPAYAQDASMSLIEFSDFFYHSVFADSENPLSRWEQMQENQERLTRWLEGKQHVRILGKSIDLEMSIAGRKFISCHGRGNIPDGEIFTGPVEDSVNGTVRFSFPCIWSGVEVSGVELVFEKGKVVNGELVKCCRLFCGGNVRPRPRIARVI
jgi:aminopeptidase